jgi:hypothetical protein
MHIFYIQFEAEPQPKSEAFGSCGGAYVNCWVQASSELEAIVKASAAVSESGWKILSVEEECSEASEDWYSNDDEGREYFHRAVSDGECYVFHQWPLEPQEGDDVH